MKNSSVWMIVVLAGATTLAGAQTGSGGKTSGMGTMGPASGATGTTATPPAGNSGNPAGPAGNAGASPRGYSMPSGAVDNAGPMGAQTGAADRAADTSGGSWTSPSTAGTSDLGGQIQDALRNEPTLTHDNIQVEVNDTQIVLSGTAATRKEKQTAERITQSFAENRRVLDHIKVSGSKAHGESGSMQEEPPRY